jgi:uncharacterized membrane protein
MVFGSLLLLGAIFVLPDSVLPIILGIPFILFFPGYAILAALFPRSKDLSIIERTAISFGMSIGIGSVVGVGLNYSDFGASLNLVLLSISGITLILSLTALFSRNRTEDAYLPVFPNLGLRKTTSFSRQGGNPHKFVSILLAIAIIVSALALVYMVANPPQGESFTEFYILGPNGNASGYPQNLVVGQAASVQLGIVNHENRQVNYTLEVWLSNTTIANNQTTVNTMYLFETRNITLPSEPVSLVGNSTKQYETNYTFQVELQGHFRLFFLLYKDHEPVLPDSPMIPYRDYAATQAFRITDAVKNNVMSLNLLLNVNPPQ